PLFSSPFLFCFPLLLPPPPRSTLFPYTTLFRSSVTVAPNILPFGVGTPFCRKYFFVFSLCTQMEIALLGTASPRVTEKCYFHLRSEEHTSELQSRFDLVCRLLLEKKKIN